MEFSKKYYKSQKNARKEIDLKMCGNKSAVLQVEDFILKAKDMKKEISILADSIVDKEKKKLFYDTAIELIPYGKFNATLIHPPKESPFVLFDTSIFDFFGNMSCLYTTLYSNKVKKNVIKFTDNDVIDVIYSSYSIFYDGLEWDSNLEAIYAQKLNYRDIHEENRQQAGLFSLASRLFIISHEVGHLYYNDQIDDAKKQTPHADSFWDSLNGNMLSHQKERLADIFAVEVMLNFASTYIDNPPVFLGILNGVYFCMEAIDSMQILAGDHMEIGGIKQIRVNEKPTHPIGGFRKSEYRDRLKEIFKESFDELFDSSIKYTEIMRPFLDKIVSGEPASDHYFQLQKLRKDLISEPWVWDESTANIVYK